MVRHFLELDGAKTMSTSGFALARRCLSDCVEARALGVVHGDAGVGKTFAIEYASERTKIETHWFTFAKQPAISHIVKQSLEQITGLGHHGERFKLISDLLEVLREKPRLLVVDEAQQLTADAFDFLRFLHDDPGTQFALMLVGGHGCWKTLSRYPMLLSRVYRRVGVQPLAEDEVAKLIPRYHPVHAEADLELLLWVNEEFAQGNFRRWAAFTRTVSGLCEERGENTYDRKLAAAALSLLPNWDSRVAA